MFRRNPFSFLIAAALACGGGLGGGGALQLSAISAAANPNTAGDVHSLLESGDRY